MKEKLVFSFLVVLTTGLMGSSFVVAKIGLTYISPLLLAGLRFVIAGCIMLVFVRLFKRKQPANKGEWGKLILIGAIQTAGVMGSIFLSLRTITSGESAILTFMNPLLVVLIGTLALGIRYRVVQWTGVLLGFAGVFIAMGSHLTIEIGTFLGFLSAVFWSVGTLIIKKWGGLFDIWVMTAYQMFFGGLILLVGSVFLETSRLVINSSSILILLWLAIPASIIQFTVWFYLLQKGDSGKVSAFLFLAPLFGILFGWLVLGEQLGLPLLIGGSLIFAGIFLVNWPEKQLAEEAAA
ncbi:DMT family transporter [Microbacterium sp. APC 3898]|uniref:DMT family transporter n=1 Tax=Planococcus notacanthi TaxID=3035188 RepID=A0ABT7ZIH6_9BACL|nr:MULTISPECIES: DMT family transporter [Terrabacteria group]MBF6634870.1 EamA family transporter [Planococcus sp. (in: firmicutes)]MDN3426718.1 DMT family transporter [Planococcus sp. APC 4016]MDN3500228.1 DMT family transporter [Microbacterium sp. APC 3898]